MIVTLFCVGMMMGSLFSNKLYMPMDSQMKEIESLVDNFIVNININSLPRPYLFTRSLITYGKQVLLIWLFGLFSLTIPLIGLLVGVLGFSYGFTTSFFVMKYNLKGLLICFAAYGIQGTLFTVMIFLLATESIGFGKKEKTISLKPYMIYLFTGITFVVILSLYEAYLAPIFIQHTITTFF